MGIIFVIAQKVAWWAIPKVLGLMVDYIETAVETVNLAAQPKKPTGTKRREQALARLTELYPHVPEMIHRTAIEAALILSQLGVSPDNLNAVEALVADVDQEQLSNAEKRNAVLKRLAEQFTDLPERIARLLVELAVAKLRGREQEQT